MNRRRVISADRWEVVNLHRPRVVSLHRRGVVNLTVPSILYIRVSTDEQAEKGNSLRHQEEKLRQHCALNNIEIVGFFKEDHSAKSFDRPEFKRLLEFLKKNKQAADMLLFLKWDRFSRNEPEAYAMIATLQKFNVEPQAMEQPLDLSVPENKIMLAIYLTAPEVENDRRALNIIAGMRRAIKDGRFMGHAPYGYKHSRTEQNKPCIAPGKDAQLVQYAFAEMATGIYHIEEMRKIVAKKGLKIPRTRFWVMLRNPFYIGKILVPAYKDEPAEIIKGQHEPLISERIFYEVQDVLEGRKRKSLPTNTLQRDELMLRGFLTCAKCGEKLTGSASKGKLGIRYFYYHCKGGCKERFRADAAHETFLSMLSAVSSNEKALRYLEAVIKDSYLKDDKERLAELGKINKELDTLQTRLSNAQTLVLDGALDGSEYKAIKAKIEPEIQRLRFRQADLKVGGRDEEELIEFGFDFLRNFSKRLGSADLEEKRRLVGSTFPGRLIFENGKCRTPENDNILLLIAAPGAGFGGKRKSATDESAALSRWVEPGDGMSNFLVADLRLIEMVLQTQAVAFKPPTCGLC